MGNEGVPISSDELRGLSDAEKIVFGVVSAPSGDETIYVGRGRMPTREWDETRPRLRESGFSYDPSLQMWHRTTV